MLIYIDDNYMCHTSDDGTMRQFEVSFFDDKPDEVIEKYLYIPEGEVYTHKDGQTFEGEQVTPAIDYGEIWPILANHEHKLLVQFKKDLADADAALAELGVNTNG